MKTVADRINLPLAVLLVAMLALGLGVGGIVNDRMNDPLAAPQVVTKVNDLTATKEASQRLVGLYQGINRLDAANLEFAETLESAMQNKAVDERGYFELATLGFQLTDVSKQLKATAARSPVGLSVEDAFSVVNSAIGLGSTVFAQRRGVSYITDSGYASTRVLTTLDHVNDSLTKLAHDVAPANYSIVVHSN